MEVRLQMEMRLRAEYICGRIRNAKDSGDDGCHGIFMSGGTTNVEGGYIVDCGANKENGGGISLSGVVFLAWERRKKRQ